MSYIYNKGFSFKISKYSDDASTIQMTEEYNDLSDILAYTSKAWGDAQARHEALLCADEKAIKRLRSNAETLLSILNHTYTEKDIQELINE